MKSIFKVTVFVHANLDQGESEHRFPRLRLVCLLRTFFDHSSLGETVAMVDESWPLQVRERLATHDDGYTPGIRTSFITDESGLGRITLAAHKRGFRDVIEIEDIEELSTSATVVFGG